MINSGVLEGAKEAFFKAMMDGYAGDCKNSVKTLSNNGNTKTITFVDGEYRVVDEYHTKPHSDFSTGTTTIFHNDVPVWWMSYGGRYQKSAITFLKEALRESYEKGQFNKGRGPESYHGTPSGDTWLHYKCIGIIGGQSSFHEFHGFESVTEIKGSGPLQVQNQLGFHYFMGMSLL